MEMGERGAGKKGQQQMPSRPHQLDMNYSMFQIVDRINVYLAGKFSQNSWQVVLGKCRFFLCSGFAETALKKISTCRLEEKKMCVGMATA